MLLKNAEIINPESNFQGKSDIRIENGLIKEISDSINPFADEEVIDIINSSTDLTAKYDYTYLSENETIVRIKER